MEPHNLGNFSFKKKNLTARINGIQRAIDLDPNKAYLIDLEEKLKRELDLILDQEEEFWALRARTNWIMAGDRNTKFFHTSATIRRNRNKIEFLKTTCGKELWGEHEIKEEIINFFQNLFTTENSTSLKVHEILDEIVESTFNCAEVPSHSEIKEALFSIGSLKAPGSDGFHAIFLKNFWDTISRDCINLVQNVFTSKKIPNGLNKTLVALIPKSDNPERISQFRPISLVNSSFKIISKILVKRMRPVLSKIISPNQNSFIAGRGTDVNFIIASEILHSMGKKKGKKGTFAMKIDLEKAYDRLEWDFIRASLLNLGFDEDTSKLCMECITTTSTSILINGHPSKEFLPSRGIRQGDPLSPYIFIICMEMLSRIIHKSCEENKWKPFRLRGGSTSISHLMFADDLILFGEATPQTLLAVRESLSLFFKLSGQKMNNGKSKIFFSPNTPQSLVDEFEQDLDVLAAKDLGIYLGFPLSNKRPAKKHFQNIVGKLENKLSLWKANSLSKAGRALLISSTLQSIPRYFMQGLHFPKSITKKMDSISANFLWGNKDKKKGLNCISWDNICKPKILGGLGFRTNEELNILGLTKQCWNLDNQKNWAARFMAEKYLRKNIGPISFNKRVVHLEKHRERLEFL